MRKSRLTNRSFVSLERDVPWWTLASRDADPGHDVENCEEVRSLLSALSPRSAAVLRLRFGIESRPHSFDRISDILGVSRERIRQIFAESLQELRSFDKTGVSASEFREQCRQQAAALRRSFAEKAQRRPSCPPFDPDFVLEDW